MSIADDIDRLAAQRDAGTISQAEFEAAKAKLLSHAGATADVTVNSLRRSVTDRWIGGVCGGLAKLTGLESWVWRLIFCLAVLFYGFGLLPYVLMWIFVPSETAPSSSVPTP